MPAETLLDQTSADLAGEKVVIVSGTPSAGQVASFTDATHVEGIAAPTSGKVLQVVTSASGAVATGTTVIPIDDTIPQQTEGDQYMSVSITPLNAASQLRVDVVWNGASDAANFNTIVALFRDAGANAIAAAVRFNTPTASALTSFAFTAIVAAGSTAATTFKVRAGAQAGTLTFNGAAGARYLGGVMASSITVTEIAP